MTTLTVHGHNERYIVTSASNSVVK